jgi:hypothetical protein
MCGAYPHHHHVTISSGNGSSTCGHFSSHYCNMFCKSADEMLTRIPDYLVSLHAAGSNAALMRELACIIGKLIEQHLYMHTIHALCLTAAAIKLDRRQQQLIIQYIFMFMDT